jgi:HK97 family phage major capsid protein
MKTKARHYSLTEAVLDEIHPGRNRAGFEREVSQEIAKRTGVPATGIYMPLGAMGKRTLSAGSGDGANLVSDDTDQLIDALAEDLVLDDLGVTFMSGLAGNQTLPRALADPNVEWVSEGSAATEGTSTFDTVTLTPHTVSAWVPVSRQLLVQSSLDLERELVRRLRQALLREMERKALHGSGSSNEPTGLASTTGIGSVAGGTNGAAPTLDHLAKLHKEVAVDDAAQGSLAYVSNPAVTFKLLTTPRVSGTDSKMLLDDLGGSLLGRRYVESNLVASDLDKGDATGVCSAIFYGNWADLVIGLWGPGAVDIRVDPYSQATSGKVRIVAHLLCDVGVLRPQSFAAMLDALTT